ncbi:MAG: DUF485 domain-containing protein [Pseudomonadota bacterium]
MITKRLSALSRWTVSVFFTLYLVLLLGVALFSDALAAHLALGLSMGQWLVLILHVGPVIMAWIYISRGDGLEDESASEGDAL